MRFFTVCGTGNFPLYLLHVDKCWPCGPGDAENMAYAMPTQVKESRAITLATNSPKFSGNLWREAKWPIVSTW